MATLNPAQIERLLNGVRYPASRADLVKQAERNGADESACQILSNLPNQSYDSIAAVNRALGSQQGQVQGQGQSGNGSRDQDLDQAQQGKQKANR